jgi:L-threonylcarbamoyladenylate synthase
VSTGLVQGEVAAFDRCIAAGGVALFPTDTVYGLAVDPESRQAVERLYALKGRPPERPAAVMFFDLEAALSALPELGSRTAEALRRLLPGGVTALLPNPPRRYPLACGPAPERLGLRVPKLGGALAALAEAGGPVLQSSANVSGGSEARRLDEVDPVIRRGVDVELDGGELSGTPSTVVDLTAYEEEGRHAVVRVGAVPAEEVAAAL